MERFVKRIFGRRPISGVKSTRARWRCTSVRRSTAVRRKHVSRTTHVPKTGWKTTLKAVQFSLYLRYICWSKNFECKKIIHINVILMQGRHTLRQMQGRIFRVAVFHGLCTQCRVQLSVSVLDHHCRVRSPLLPLLRV